MSDVNKVMEILPHRYPFMLVDKILEVTDNYAKCQKNVTFNEEFFQGHFPGYPVMPGVLILEALAQTACILGNNLGEEVSEDKVVFFMGIDKAKFRKPVVPGDVLILNTELISFKRGILKVNAYAEVDGNKVCEAVLTAIVKGK